MRITQLRIALAAAPLALVALVAARGASAAVSTPRASAVPVAMDVQADVSPGFTYQGVLTEDGLPVTGRRQMEFQLFDAASGGAQVGVTKAHELAVANGQFSVALTWGTDQFDGRALWLQVRVQDGGGIWRSLGRRQILAVPYAFSLQPGAKIVQTSGSYALYARNSDQDALFGSGAAVGVRGETTGSREEDAGVVGQSADVSGHARGGIFTSFGGSGLYAASLLSDGLEAKGCDSPGCFGGHFEGDSGIYAKEQDDGDPTRNFAGYFDGDVYVGDEMHVRGTLTADRRVAAESLQVTGGAGVDGNFAVGGDGRFLQAVRIDGPLTSSFPRPAYYGAWRSISTDSTVTFKHDLGGDPNDYVVELRCKDSGGTIHIRGLGGDEVSATLANAEGVYWSSLSDTSISVRRQPNNCCCQQVSVRIWVIR